MLSGRVVDGDLQAASTFHPIPGGAPANVAVAVARLGGASYFAGAVARDRFGEFLLDALRANGVRVDFVRQSQTGKTALAFVDLDDAGERRFSFYGEDAAHLDFGTDDLPGSVFDEPVIFHFGSNTLTGERIRTTTNELVNAAKRGGAVVSFDINFREGLWQDPAEAPAAILAIGASCDVIKSSREELVALFGERRQQATIQGWLKRGVALVVVTDGGGDVRYYGRDFDGTVATPAVEVVDTTAAGDAFVGGLLYRLAGGIDGGETWPPNDPAAIRQSIEFAVVCGAFAVTRAGAFVSLPTLEELGRR